MLPMITKYAILRYNHPCKDTISHIEFLSLSANGLYKVYATAVPIPNSAKFMNCNKFVAVVVRPKTSSPKYSKNTFLEKNCRIRLTK